MAGLDELVPVVNRIQDLVIANANCGTLDLPQVVVVGAQSSGKSSVIELLVRQDFLPRGTGIVTRRPLAITLINDKEEYFEFLHLKNERFTSNEDVRAEIERETFRIAGPDKGISSVPISLKVHSPHVLDLTLVDLPGVTKVPVGDQPAEIEKLTKDLVFQYISNPNSIILAITPANQDIVNSESLDLARKVDPQGKRTLGVLTKLDLMDSGTDAVDVLSGQTYPLKLGFIGIVNRSQSDVIQKKSLEASIAAEHEFFNTHPSYRSMASKLGTEYLSKTLNQILMQHIRARLPDLRARINGLITETEHDLRKLGPQLDNKEKGPLVLTMMLDFAAKFTGSIDGNAVFTGSELSGGAKIYEIFASVFDKRLNELDPVSRLSVEDVRVAIRNSAGPRASLFVPERAFDILMKPLISAFLSPSQQCVQLTFEELLRLCHTCADLDLKRYPTFKHKLLETLSKMLNEHLQKTTQYIASLIDVQAAYINTSHPRFISTSEVVAFALANEPSADLDASSALDSIENRKSAPLPAVANDIADLSIDEQADSESSGHSTVKSASKSPAKSATKSSSPVIGANSAVSVLNDMPSSQNEDDSKREFLNRFFGKPDQQPSYVKPSPKPMDFDSKDQMECRIMYKLIESYFQVVRETVSDQVPKAIMHFMVNSAKSKIQSCLITELYKEDLFDELLYEDKQVVQERQKLLDTLDTYKEASKVISEVL